tara:strand:+ start:734 stop:3151 length:2418 start_codon:yes stop_codon:yes gene_type:complete
VLDSDTRRKIDTLRDILVGKIPNPQTQVEQITTGLIYKFMDDMDQESIEMGGEGSFFVGDYEKYAWKNLLDPKLSGVDKVNLYSQAIEGMYLNPSAPQLFRDIFKNAFLPFKDPSTLNMFLKEINEFNYSHSEKLGDAFEYLISIMGSQGDAGQFRTPRHIIDFIVEIIDPQKNETILDPACGTAGFLISSYKHILKTNTDKKLGDKLSAEDKKRVGENVTGYDISPEMIRLSLVNMYLHGFSTPKIEEYDTLSSEDKWNEYFDVILANPPFFSPKGGIQPHKRFGVESKKAEVLFTSYILEHLKPNGRAGIIIPEGIIFQNGKAYKELRKQILENALIGVISLPAGVFQPYSGVKTSILILDKKLSKETDSIFFVEVKNDGFSLGTQRTPIKENDLPELVKNLRNKKHDSERIKRVSKEEILDSSDFSFSYSTYQKQDINNSNFEMVKMGDIADFQNGYAFKPSNWEETGKPIIRIQNLTKSGKDINRTRLEVDQKYHVEKGDLLISWSATIGIYIWEGESALLNQHIFLVKPGNRILKSYLYFLGSKIKRDIESKVHGNTMTHITKGKFLNIEIPLPSLEVQQEIVDELEGYQKIIDGCKQVIENYKPTIDIEPSWEMVELGEVSTKITDGTHKTPKYKESGVPFLRVTDITKTNDSKKFISKDEHLDLIKRCHPEKGDLLYSKNGTIGVAKLVDWDYDFSIFVSLCLIKPNNEKILSSYLEETLNSNNVYKQAINFSKSGTVTNLHLVEIKQIKIPLPPIETQKEIVQKIEEERKVIGGNKKLIEIYTQKIQDRINKVYGED